MKDNDDNELRLEEKIKNDYNDILYYSSTKSKDSVNKIFNSVLVHLLLKFQKSSLSIIIHNNKHIQILVS